MIYEIHKNIIFILKEYLQKKVFTSCELGFFANNKQYILYLDNNNVSFSSNHYFDLASLTKILVTVPSLWSLLSENKINSYTKVYQIYPDVVNLSKDIEIMDLLNHISGLPAHRFFLKKESMSSAEKNILNELCGKTVKGNLIYSDLGYILLGRIIEKISGMRLDKYWVEKVVKPLNIKNIFFPSLLEGTFLNEKFVPTGICPQNGKILRGIVHDDNCRILGGVCGHAGLFGNCFGILDFLFKILEIYKGKTTNLSLSSNILRKNINKNIKTRRFGFDTPAKKNSSCGDFFSDLTIGHLGFTGTSAWLDIKKEVGVVLLTNRTFCGDNVEGIRSLRPKIHNAIMENIPYKK